MKKRGISTHVDWTISMTIFLTYILLLFIFIKPTLRESFDNEILFSIVKDNFDKNIRWAVEKTPLFFEATHSTSEEPVYKILVANNPYKDHEYSTNINILKEDGRQVNKFKVTDDEIRIEVDERNLITGKNILWVFHANKDLHSYDVPSDPSCNNPENPSSCELGLADPEYGVTLFLVGISGKRLNNFKTLNYNLLKETWGYPAVKEFEIKVNDVIINGNKQELSTQDIFIKRYKDEILDENGVKTIVDVVIKVW